MIFVFPFLFARAGQWVDFYIPGIDKVGGFSMCSSPQQLKESGTLELAIKDSTWPPADWLHRKARVGDKVEMVVGAFVRPRLKFTVN